MVITIDSRTELGELCLAVDQMKPGDALKIEYGTLRRIPNVHHNEAIFTPAHRILGNVVGSAFTHSFSENPVDGSVTFYRHESTRKRRSFDPDDDFRKRRLEEMRGRQEQEGDWW